MQRDLAWVVNRHGEVVAVAVVRIYDHHRRVEGEIRLADGEMLVMIGARIGPVRSL